jgi:hypothetical protein
LAIERMSVEAPEVAAVVMDAPMLDGDASG